MKMIYRTSALLIKQFRGNIGFARIRSLASVLCVLCALCGSPLAQDFKTVHNGIEYAEIQHKIGNDPVKINLLRLDLKKVRLDVHKANDRAIGLETTSSIAKRKSAVAAINAGFFRLDNSFFAGEAVGILQIDGKLLSESNGLRIELLIGNGPVETQVFFARLGIEQQVVLFDREIFRNVGINREQKEHDFVIYTPEFGSSSPANMDAWACIVQDEHIRDCREGVSVIPENAVVISVSGSFRDRLQRLNTYRKRVDFPTLKNVMENEVYKAWSKNRNSWDAVGGVPQLIKNGKIDITWEQEKASKTFVFNRHPRTAVAKFKDGKFLMITVDGRQPGVSVGMTLPELAEYLHSLGAVDAMNLDGGGSTTMYLDGKVVNRPSDPTGERKVSDVLVVTLRGKTVRRLR